MRLRPHTPILSTAMTGALATWLAMGCAASSPDALQEDVSTGEPAAVTSFTVVDTGQDRCWDNAVEISCPAAGDEYFGQDSQYQGTSFALLDNGDGTVSDQNTGLMWQKTPGDKLTWADAQKAAESFSLAGHDDWRLPTIKELYSLMDFRGITGLSASTSVPYLDTTVFDFSYGDESAGERFIDAQYCSSTKYVSTTMGGDATVFGVNFADGRIKGYPISVPSGEEKLFDVRFVRGDTGYGVNDYLANVNGTVTDRATGLTWQQADDGAGRNWSDALSYCGALSLGGADDWRLPNAKELQGIVDYARSPDTTASAAIDPAFDVSTVLDPEGQTAWPAFWTATTHLDGASPGTYAVYVAFGEAQGFMEMPPGSGQVTLLDVHGAGSQRSDPKSGNAADFPQGHGPQGDVIVILNHVRCVRGGAKQEAVEPSSPRPSASGPGDRRGPPDDRRGPPDDSRRRGGPQSCAAQADCEVAGACPPDATLGCTCSEDPTGAKRCIPACKVDDDCPAPPDMTLVCGSGGVCVPE